VIEQSSSSSSAKLKEDSVNFAPAEINTSMR
jgi:hypothetical protein